MTSEKINAQLLEQKKNEQERPELAMMRSRTGLFVADSFRQFGEALQLISAIPGDNQIDGPSPLNFEPDEIYGMSLILRIGSELSANTIRLFQGKQTYAASALLRQIVEVEYLAWAFENRHGDAKKWLKSDKNERWEFFRAKKLQNAAKQRFRAQDYGYHCDNGGHPTPNAMTLLNNDSFIIQLLLSDLLVHMSGIWNHFSGWSKQHQKSILPHTSASFISLGADTGKFLNEWMATDPLQKLEPPPFKQP